MLQDKPATLPNVSVATSALTTEVHGDGDKVTGLTYQDRNSNGLFRQDLDGIFVQIGLVPNTEFLKGALALSQRGEIEVTAKGETRASARHLRGGRRHHQPLYKQIVIAMGAPRDSRIAPIPSRG